MMLKMIDHLQTKFVLNRRSMLLFLAFLDWLLTHCSFLTHTWVCMAKSSEFYPIADRVPFEVEHRMNRLNLDPPTSLLQCVSYQT